MKYLYLFIIILFSCAPAMASQLYPIPEDAFSSPDNAAEAGKLILLNFQELWSSKVDVSSPSANQIQYYLSDLTDPDEADYNAFAIMADADDLWTNKQENSSDANLGTRSIPVVDLLDPARIEDNIAAINLIFYELDAAKDE